jgi:hypothetical protein
LEKCRICGEEMGRVTGTHLETHGTNMKEYRRDYPDPDDVLIAKAYHYVNGAEGEGTMTMRDLERLTDINKSQLHKRIRPLLDVLEEDKDLEPYEEDDGKPKGKDDEEKKNEAEKTTGTKEEVEIETEREKEKDEDRRRKVEPIDVGIIISIVLAAALAARIIL